jgi:uncharacterized protein
MMNTSNSNREDFADELRGFALLGIVVVNAPFLGISGHGFTQASLATVADQVAAFATVAFAQAKFYLLFSFLFGYSLSFLIKPGDAASIRRFKRRLVGLAVLGVLHAVLFFVGDILLIYAVFGCALLWLHHKPDTTVRKVIIVAIWLWLSVLLLLLLGTWAAPEGSDMLAAVKALDLAMQSGSFLTAAKARFTFWPDVLVMLLALNGLGVLAMFALGLLAGRKRLFAEPDGARAVWHRGARYGWLIGLPAALLSAFLTVGYGAAIDSPGSRETLGIVIGFGTAPFLTFGYVSWLARLRMRWPNVLQWCRRAGRMSLTGYLGESILLSLIFCGYGLGWFGKLGAATVMLVAIGVWLLLDVFAQWWQRRAQYGPFEWVLRAWVKRAHTADQ